MLKKFLIGTLAVVAFMITANLALASYDFGSAILKVGSRGQYVTTLQNLVVATPVDGIFGPKTKAKVVAWQVVNGLKADGLFGNLSKAKANETDTNFGAGCTNASGFSTTTGLNCSSLNANTFSVGCTNASGFSTTTGLNCSSLNANTFSVGCTNASGFSITTGLACSSLSAHTFPAGCTNASGFSTTTGFSCLTGLIAVRGGGSSGSHSKANVSAPSAPTLASKTATSITLTANALNEFSNGGGAWQDSGLFSGLTPLTSYTFTARVKETGTTNASLASVASESITTDAPVMTGSVVISGTEKFGQELTATPSLTYTPTTSSDIPTYQWKRAGSAIGSATASTYTLALADIGTVITVTVTADGTHATGNVTSSATGAIAKADVSAPSAPTEASKTATSITLTAMSGNEFRNGGGAWQDSNVFTGLSELTTYTFITRVKATDTTNASAVSSSTSVTTLSNDATLLSGTLGGEVINNLDSFGWGEGGIDPGGSHGLTVTLPAGTHTLALVKGDSNSVVTYVQLHSADGTPLVGDYVNTYTVSPATTFVIDSSNDRIWLKVTSEDGSSVGYFWVIVTFEAQAIASATATSSSPAIGDAGINATVDGGANYTHTSTVWSGRANATYVTGETPVAVITLTPKTGYTFYGLLDTGITVTGGTVTYAEGQGVLGGGTSVVFTVTYLQLIQDIATAGVTGFVVPITDATPQAFGTLTAVGATYSVTGLTWSPVHNPYQGSTAYTATVTLTSGANYKFPVGNIASPTTDVETVNSIGTTAGGNASGNTLSYTVLFPATAAPVTGDMAFALTTPAENGTTNTLTVNQSGSPKFVNVDVVRNTSSVVITGTKTVGQTVVVGDYGGDVSDNDRYNVTVTGTPTAPIYTVNMVTASQGFPGTDVHLGGSKTFKLTISEADKSDIVYQVNVQVSSLLNPVTSAVFTTSTATTLITITLAEGSFKAAPIYSTDFTFAGTDATAIAANGTFGRPDATHVTISGLDGHLAGDTNNTITVKGATQATQVITVTAVAS